MRDLHLGALAEFEDEAYENLAPFQWPRPAQDLSLSSDTRFFANGGFFTDDRKARFLAVAPPHRETTEARHAFTLNTGRIRDHWHTMTRTAKSARLSAHIAEPFAEIHPGDAKALGIGEADLVRVMNDRAEIVVRALITDRQQRGNVFVPMHWTDQWASSARVDRLVAPEADPFSGQSALKKTAVSLARFEARQFGFVVSQHKPDLVSSAYWAVARTGDGWRAEFALTQDHADQQGFVCRVLGLDEATPLLSFTDPQNGLARHAAFDGTSLTGAVFLSRQPVTVSRNWAAEQLHQDYTNLSSRWRIVAGRPANDIPDKGAIVCACMNVGVNDIIGAISGGCGSVDAIARATSAGTNCGSCKAEIKVILDEHQIIAAE